VSVFDYEPEAQASECLLLPELSTLSTLSTRWRFGLVIVKPSVCGCALRLPIENLKSYGHDASLVVRAVDDLHRYAHTISDLAARDVLLATFRGQIPGWRFLARTRSRWARDRPPSPRAFREAHPGRRRGRTFARESRRPRLPAAPLSACAAIAGYTELWMVAEGQLPAHGELMGS